MAADEVTRGQNILLFMVMTVPMLQSELIIID